MIVHVEDPVVPRPIRTTVILRARAAHVESAEPAAGSAKVNR